MEPSRTTWIFAVLVTCAFAGWHAVHVSGGSMDGKSYYVSVSGHDANPGTAEDPWRTMQKAVNTMAPGDTTFVREGVYDEFVAIDGEFGHDGTHSLSGTPENPIRLTAYPGEEVIWQNDLSFPPGHRARYEMLRIYRCDNWVIQGFRFENTAEAPSTSDWWGYGIWLEYANGTVIRNNTFDGNAIPRPGGVVVNLRRQSDGCTIEGNTFFDWPSSSDLVGILLESNWREVSDAKDLVVNHNTVIRGNQMEGIGGDCVQIGEFGGSYTLIENNSCWMKYNDEIHKSTEEFADIKFSGHTVIRGNTAWGSRPKWSSRGGAAVIIHLSAEDVLVEDNVFYDNGAGIGLGVGHPANFPKWFTEERSPERITIRRNVIYDANQKRSWDGVAGGGIGIDASGIKNLHIYHNTLAYCSSVGIRLENNDKVTILNNIFYESGFRHIWDKPANPTDWNQLTIDGNLFDRSSTIGYRLPDRTFFNGHVPDFRSRTGQCANCIEADPSFANPTSDPATANFGLLPMSPAIDSAVTIRGYNDTDFSALGPDIGSYERVIVDDRSGRAGTR